MEQQALQQVAAGTINNLFMGIGALSKAFYQKYGKEALPIITKVMEQGGEESGKAVQQMMPVKSFKALNEMFINMAAMMGMKMDVLELSDEVFHFKVPKCPLGIEGTSKELCEALMSIDQKRASAFLGKKVDMEIPTSVAVGDKECDVIFSVK